MTAPKESSGVFREPLVDVDVLRHVVGVTVISLLNGIVGLVTRPHEPAALPQ